jgi:hypothetical protein
VGGCSVRRPDHPGVEAPQLAPSASVLVPDSGWKCLRLLPAPERLCGAGQVTRSTPIKHLHNDLLLGHAIQGKYLTVEALTKEGIQIIQIGLHVHLAFPVLGDVE